MDPKIESFVMALNDFAEAASALAEEWEIASELVQAADEGYPFADSFDELSLAIQRWRGKALANLSKQLGEPLA